MPVFGVGNVYRFWTPMVLPRSFELQFTVMRDWRLKGTNTSIGHWVYMCYLPLACGEETEREWKQFLELTRGSR